MRKFMMKYLMVNCREATMLMTKKEEGKISFREKLSLMLHTSMCSFCRRFEKQTTTIGSESKHVHAEGDQLTASSREKIERILDVNS
ncbi:MAG: zf-HC2 domain-containing protein [Bacteroidetes bacterium]|nr:zf-HC2 domain-containing protein [Bacteroidota bacterium]